MNTIERKLLIEQAKKEEREELLKYKVGSIIDGRVLVSDKPNKPIPNGYMFVIPKEKYKEWFDGE